MHIILLSYNRKKKTLTNLRLFWR